MPPPHLGQLGSWDFSAYLRVGPDEGLDPYSPVIEEPSFSEAPFAEGQPLISISAKNREGVYPLFLGSATSPLSKDQMHALQRTAALACKEPGLRLQWRDAGATATSYFDVTYARFEPTFHYRRSQKGWLAGVLRVFSAPPYAHTASERIVASANATGAMVAFSIPSAIQGDADAQPVLTITAGSQLPFRGDVIYGMAVLPHPSYQADIPAASFTDLTVRSAFTLSGASGALGSQAVTTAGALARLKAPLSIPSVYAGQRHRVMALAKRYNEPYNTLVARGPQGEQLGPTALATAVRGWQLVDLGVLALPTVPIPSAAITVDMGGGEIFSVAEGGGINRIFIFPEEQSTFWLDRPGRPQLMAYDEFANNYPTPASLWGGLEDGGLPWAPFPTSNPFPATTMAPYEYQSDVVMPGAEVSIGVPSLGRAGAIVAGATFRDGTIIAKIQALGSAAHASSAYQIGKNVFDQNGLLGARLTGGTLPWLGIYSGNNSQAASVGIAATSFITGFGGDILELSVTFKDGMVTANLRQAMDTPFTNTLGSVIAVASVGASLIAAGENGVMGFFLSNACTAALAPPRDPKLHWMALESSAGSAILARGQAVLDSVRGQFYRQAGSSWQEDIADVQRGPRLTVAPSSAAIAVLAHPLHGGAANDLLRAEITMRERFSFAR